MQRDLRPDRRVHPAATSLLPALLSSVLVVLPGVAGAQNPDPSELESFGELTRVLEVQVPVNVVDRNGRPIRRLSAEDFEIFDEGTRQEILGFEVIDLDLLAPDPLRPAAADSAIPKAARRYFLFLFDLSFSSPTAVVRARLAAREFVLDKMHPTDLAAVATHSIEGGPKLIMTFSPDRSQLARAIDTLGAPRLLRLAVRDPLRFLIDLPDVARGLSALDVGGVNESVSRLGEEQETLASYLSVIGNQMAKVEKSYAVGRISSWTVSMGEMARLLGSIQGRKHVVYFSEGFDGRLLLGRQPDFFDQRLQQEADDVVSGRYFMVDSDDRFGNTQLQRSMATMLGEFSRADSVIQVVDISGLRADLPTQDRTHRVGRDALFYIANETGGQLYEDANDFGHQLERVLERSTVTYLLSFRPSDLGDAGEYRRIKVRAKTPRGAKLSHRSGYRVPRPFADLHPMEKSFLAADLIATATLRNDLSIHALAAPFRANEEEAYVPVIIEIDGEDLLAGHDEDHLPVELYAYVTDDRGEMQDFFTRLVTLDLSRSREALAATGLKYYGHLNLGSGEYLIRVLVRNALTGTTAVRTVRVSVPEYAKQEPMLLPPFFLEEPGSWFLVREKQAEGGELATMVYPFTVNGDPYVPAALPRLDGDGEAELCLVAYNLGKGRLEVSGRVETADGTRVTGGELQLRERTVTGIEGLDKLTATFRTAGLAKGDYTLRVSIKDSGSDGEETAFIPFRVLGAKTDS